MSAPPSSGPVPPRRDAALPPREDKAAAVRHMFAAIAPRYDLLNHVLSFNIDRLWRKRAVDLLLSRAPARGLFLDCCAGTMDFALELAKRTGFQGQVVASDFAVPMLQYGSEKIGVVAVAPVGADALRLPFRDAQFDGATVGFGIRNLADLDAGVRELARVLKPGAPLIILEFATPTWAPFRALYLFYFRRLLPLIGRLVSGNERAYAYLPASVLEFPAPPALATRLQSAGFSAVKWEVRTGGIVAVHSAARRT